MPPAEWHPPHPSASRGATSRWYVTAGGPPAARGPLGPLQAAIQSNGRARDTPHTMPCAGRSGHEECIVAPMTDRGPSFRVAVAALAFLAVLAHAPAVWAPFSFDDRYVLAHLSSPRWSDRIAAFDVDLPGADLGAWWD